VPWDAFVVDPADAKPYLPAGQHKEPTMTTDVAHAVGCLTCKYVDLTRVGRKAHPNGNVR
jgi:hypothetical protein